MKMTFIRIILFFGVFILWSADSYAYEDLTTKIKAAYTNDSGSMLIQTVATHGSPEVWLKVGSDNQVTNPASRTMYATALVALTAGKNCWVRIVPTASGYWIADRISIQQ